jgi:hypothetical protein
MAATTPPFQESIVSCLATNAPIGWTIELSYSDAKSISQSDEERLPLGSRPLYSLAIGLLKGLQQSSGWVPL